MKVREAEHAAHLVVAESCHPLEGNENTEWKKQKSDVANNLQIPHPRREPPKAHDSVKPHDLHLTLKHHKSQPLQRTPNVAVPKSPTCGRRSIPSIKKGSAAHTSASNTGSSEPVRNTKRIRIQQTWREDETTIGVRRLCVVNPNPVDLDE
jgi:hypothetical protein